MADLGLRRWAGRQGMRGGDGWRLGGQIGASQVEPHLEHLEAQWSGGGQTTPVSPGPHRPVQSPFMPSGLQKLSSSRYRFFRKYCELRHVTEALQEAGAR